MLLCMGKDNPKDRHKPGARQVRIRQVFLPGLDELVRLNGSDLVEEVNRSVKERLEKEGLWPPPSS